MGILDLLCCVKRRERYGTSEVEYSSTPSNKDVHEPSRTPMRETTQSVKEATPPPVYSTNSFSKIETVVETTPVPASPPKFKQELADEEPSIIKEEPKDEQLVPYQGKMSFEDSKASKKGEALVKQEKMMSFPENKYPPPAPSQPYVFVAGGGTVSKQTDFAPSSSTALTTSLFPAPTAVFGLSSTANHPSHQTHSSALTLPSSSTFSSSAPTAVFGLLPSSNVPPQFTASSLPSSAAVPSSPPVSRFAALDWTAPPANHTPPNSSITAPSTNHTSLSSFITAPPPRYTPSLVRHPPNAGTCPSCSSPNTIKYTQSTENGNYERPYRKCSSPRCGFWNGFADTRGITPGTLCYCENAAEMRLTAKNARDRQGRRQAFYSCQFKACGAWSHHTDGMGNVTWFTEGEVERMVREGRI